MKTCSYLLLIASVLALACCLIVSPALANDCDAALSEREALPPNLILSGDAKRVLEKVWKRSPTFREQCRRISESPWVKIKVRFVAKRSEPYEALTTLTKYESGFTVSTIHIFIASGYVEKIGHEFEHIIEQIEGLNLQALAAKEGTGVRSNRPGYFETKRAVRAGQRVHEEYRRARSGCRDRV
ncbi:MAG TPA: hypothetical protein VLD57_01430 [Blastocatellia bacterium]|nr:hypothetical protein [Blastocatellia bacterium]